jgi:hypothetical protein
MSERELQDLDARISEAFWEVPIHAGYLERRVLRQISGQRRKRRAGAAAIAAAVLIAVFISKNRPPGILVDAARDHRLEVMEHKPRRWTTKLVGFEPKFGMTGMKAASLAPDGFRLLHARICGLDGQKALHLVFTDGARDLSIYVRKRPGGRNVTAQIGAEQLASASGAEYQRVAVTTGPAAECLQIARRAARLL